MIQQLWVCGSKTATNRFLNLNSRATTALTVYLPHQWCLVNVGTSNIRLVVWSRPAAGLNPSEELSGLAVWSTVQYSLVYNKVSIYLQKLYKPAGHVTCTKIICCVDSKQTCDSADLSSSSCSLLWSSRSVSSPTSLLLSLPAVLAPPLLLPSPHPLTSSSTLSPFRGGTIIVIELNLAI